MKINIKSNKGVTITGLVIYVSSFFMICAVIAIITTFFHNNTKFLSSGATASAEYDILNAYLAKEAKTTENKILSPTTVDTNPATLSNGAEMIKFSNKNQYVFVKAPGDEYGEIYLKNTTTHKYFIIANYVREAKFENNGDKFSICVKILSEEYSQTYNLAD